MLIIIVKYVRKTYVKFVNRIIMWKMILVKNVMKDVLVVRKLIKINLNVLIVLLIIHLVMQMENVTNVH